MEELLCLQFVSEKYSNDAGNVNASLESVEEHAWSDEL